MKELLRITHVDLDGISPYILDRFYNPHYKDDDYLFINYGEEYVVHPTEWETKGENHDIWLPTDYEKIVVTDLGLTEDQYIWIKKHYPNNYYWIDHHLKTEECKDSNDDRVIYDVDASGTKLYFNFLTEGKRKNRVVSEFATLVDTYDRFDDKSPLWEDAQNMNRLLYGSAVWREGLTIPQKYRKFIDSQLSKFHLFNKFSFTEEEHKIIQTQINKENIAFTEAKRMMLTRKDNKGFKFGLIQCSSKVSIVCKRILDESDDLQYIICINTFKGVNGRMHLRIKESSPLTKHHFEGFDGHEKAAGGSLEIPAITKLWGNRWNYKNSYEGN